MIRNLTFAALTLLSPTMVVAQDTSCAGANTYLVQRYAEAGDPEAQFQLSQLLSRAICEGSDLAFGLDWLHAAAAQDHGDASLILGIRYVTGLDVPEDINRGLDLMEVAASTGHLEAQFQYGMLLLDQSQSDVHRDRALYWLGAAASQGETRAALTLGHVYARGLHGVQRQGCWATDWFEAATLLAQDAKIDVSHLVPPNLHCDAS